MKMKKILALVMTGAMVLGTMSMSAFAEETEAVTEAAAAETTGDGSTPLVVGSLDMSEKFSGFFAESVPDQTIVNLTGLYLIENDLQEALFSTVQVMRVRRSHTTARIIRITHWQMLR